MGADHPITMVLLIFICLFGLTTTSKGASFTIYMYYQICWTSYKLILTINSEYLVSILLTNFFLVGQKRLENPKHLEITIPIYSDLYLIMLHRSKFAKLGTKTSWRHLSSMPQWYWLPNRTDLREKYLHKTRTFINSYCER